MHAATRAAIAAAEAACLRTLLPDGAGLSSIAIRAGVPPRRVKQALAELQRKGLIERRSDRAAWQLTAAGRQEAAGLPAKPPPAAARQRRPRTAPAVDRAWALLDRPMSARELSQRQGVTPQCAMHQIVTLAVEGRIRIADPANLGLLVARSDDPSVLLTEAQAKLLSALPEPGDPPVTQSQIAKVTGKRLDVIAAHLAVLCRSGLAVRRRSGGTDAFGLTADGAGHAQRNPAARRAVVPEPRLPVRSDRIRCVLAHLSLHGPTRTHDVGKALNLPRTSMNALMQYLKRQGLAQKAGAAQLDPHAITAKGRMVLARLEQQKLPTHSEAAKAA
jgi:DNA-binding MarR family transcriptional regulator